MRNSWGGCKLLRSGANEQEWNGVWIVGPTIQITEGRPGQCEQEERSSDEYRARIRRDVG